MSDKETGADDLSLPKATAHKIVAEALTQLSGGDKESQLIFTKDARDLLISCSMEFLRMLSSEANDISEKESKKTISIDHIESALKELGFGHYIPLCREVVKDFQEVQKKRTDRGEKMKGYGGLKDLGEGELMRMQAELLAGGGHGEKEND